MSKMAAASSASFFDAVKSNSDGMLSLKGAVTVPSPEHALVKFWEKASTFVK